MVGICSVRSRVFIDEIVVGCLVRVWDVCAVRRGGIRREEMRGAVLGHLECGCLKRPAIQISKGAWMAVVTTKPLRVRVWLCVVRGWNHGSLSAKRGAYSHLLCQRFLLPSDPAGSGQRAAGSGASAVSKQRNIQRTKANAHRST